MVSSTGVSAAYRKDNIITIGRITPLTTSPPHLVISVKTAAFSYRQIAESREFVVNHVHGALLFAADWCGIKSGYDCDKFREMKLTPEKMDGLDHAKAIEESRLSLGCKLVKEVDGYEGYGIFIGEVVSVSAWESSVTGKGVPFSWKLEALAFDGIAAEYRYTGDSPGAYGFSLKGGRDDGGGKDGG
jgi:flavin reductase (DIM6/NTAB) family NADH-FMN oxidoreductase RutF